VKKITFTNNRGSVKDHRKCFSFFRFPLLMLNLTFPLKLTF